MDGISDMYEDFFLNDDRWYDAMNDYLTKIDRKGEELEEIREDYIEEQMEIIERHFEETAEWWEETDEAMMDLAEELWEENEDTRAANSAAVLDSWIDNSAEFLDSVGDRIQTAADGIESAHDRMMNEFNEAVRRSREARSDAMD